MIASPLVAQAVKCLSTMRETQVRSLGLEDPLEKEMAAHSITIEDTIGFTLKSNSNLPGTRERRGWLPAGACKPVLGRTE